MRLPASLSSRLVLTAVSLVALAALLLGLATTVAMRAYLTDQLDREVAAALERASGASGEGRPGLPPITRGDRGGNGDRFGPIARQRVGTLTATIDSTDDQAEVLTDDDVRPLGSEALDRLGEVPVDRRGHTVELPGVGSYRVAAIGTPEGVVVTGLPTSSVDDLVGSLIWLEILLSLAVVAAAATAGSILVRRQLRPLREVAATAHEVSALPLSEGAIDLSPRVPERLTDELTEVGQVGAALNTLLSHVETSLTARHASEQQVRQFVADASHELRTPLATIKGYAELSRRTPDDAAALLAALAKVESEAGRMSSLVDDLLLLARLDAGRPLERSPVDLTRLLLETVSDARVLAPDHRWRLSLPEEAVEVVGDEARLHQVVTNLLGNARRHTPPGSTVTVGVTPGRDGGARLTVSDDGPGFDAALVGQAFERFTRGDSARTRDAHPGGAGLGLSLVRAIVSAHGGTVHLSSRPGETRFEITLPGETERLTGD
ncbi:sensor histidine kinase [Nocardioides donggukensis]|uniref:histidine kinase n=1 Tax=Nocardioides donggukensis TaxID=2774019 RepID=A0A927Q0E3_9ACTN|nr:HAMP domain-containing sensor histidine kinase [Nocardioides donggukensis]MBD8870540.1 HAMP domain-containing histidine kinase [Nocardioides donggukensis]